MDEHAMQQKERTVHKRMREQRDVGEQRNGW
jgi:hypothetical protein